MEATGQSPSLGGPRPQGSGRRCRATASRTGQWGPEAQRTLESRWGTRHPRSGGVNKSVGNFEGAPYSEQQRPTVRGEDAPASECALEKYQPRMRKATGQWPLLSTPSGQMAGVGQGTVGAPPRTQRTQTQPAGQLAAHRAGGPRRSPRGLERPLPVRTAPGRKEVPTEPQA